MQKKPLLTLYWRDYCHLCQDFLAQLEAHPDRSLFDLTLVDIEEEDELEERFGTLIPVLMVGQEELCHYHLNFPRLDAFLAKFR